MKDKIIIYVFGPKRVYDKYMSGEVLQKDNGEWLKIGLTRCSTDDQNAYSYALTRCKAESKTGIPEISYIYEVFQFPNFTQRKIDDEIRKILQDYNIESSMQNNKSINDDEIPAGQEFVYGLNRTQVINAINSYRGKILSELNTEDLKNMLIYMKTDNGCEEETEQIEVTEQTGTKRNTKTKYDENGIPVSFSKNGKFNKDFWKYILDRLIPIENQKYFNYTDSDYRNYHDWKFKYNDRTYHVSAAYKSRFGHVQFICWGVDNMSNEDFVNYINDNKLFDGLFTWENHVTQSGEKQQHMFFYKKKYNDSPYENIDELVESINKIYEYINK